MAVRPEQVIFDDLAALCASPGYAHAIAFFCFRDHVVGYRDALKGQDYAKLFSPDRLIRTEIATLIGLMVRAPRDLTTPDMKTLESYAQRTESLLRELHDCLNEPSKSELRNLIEGSSKSADFNPFANAVALREPIFYSAESAYSFQYRDLSVQKYARDEEWLKEHKGFTPQEARKVCLVSDHYPALSFQAQQFLKFNRINGIQQPLVCDVFLIDVLAELLDSPLRFLSYLELRAQAGDNLLISHEIVALGFHLRQNLWLGDYNAMQLGDDISVDVDIAMAVRRDGVEGKRTPPGILTYHRDTTVGRIIDEAERHSEPGAIGVGLELLKLNSKSVSDLSRIIDKIAGDAAKDGKSHDATLAFGQAASGITVHCNALPRQVAAPQLKRHCEIRKYSTKSGVWFGLVIRPGDAAVRFGLMLEYPWTHSAAMDAKVAAMPGPKPVGTAIKELLRKGGKRKIGRNVPCPCGSGLKYKKCHLLQGGFR